MKKLFTLLFVLSVLPVLSSYAQSVPGELNAQGRITDTQGNPINAPTSFAFSIWDQSSGGTSLWCEARTITVVNGVYWANLGDNGTPIPSSLFASSSNYLATNVAASGVICSGNAPSGGVQLSPRQRLVTVPYSFMAGGVVPEIAISTLDATQTTPYGGINVTTNVFVQGKIGIGTTSPAYNLDVNGSGNFNSLSVSGNAVLTSLSGTITANSTNTFTAPNTFDSSVTINSPLTTVPALTISSGLVVQNGNVGIGAVNPGATLEVSSVAAGGTATPVLYISTGAASSQKLLTVLGNGKVGIGTASPTNPLTVSGNANVTGSLAVTSVTGTNGTIIYSTGGGNVTTNSSYVTGVCSCGGSCGPSVYNSCTGACNQSSAQTCPYTSLGRLVAP